MWDEEHTAQFLDFQLSPFVKPMYQQVNWSDPFGRAAVMIGPNPKPLLDGSLAVSRATVVKTTYCSI